MKLYFQISNLRSEISNWWARRDSNPQPPPCKGGRLPLTYVPISNIAATFALSQGVIVGKALICVKKRDGITAFRVPTLVGPFRSTKDPSEVGTLNKRLWF